jgi:hypothetical protein
VAKKSNNGKNEIKERYNVLSQKVQIDSKALVEALLVSTNQGKVLPV